MANAIVCIESQQILPIDGETIVDIEFGNASKFVWLDNRKDIQKWIQTLYMKNDKNVILSTYHKVDSAIFWLFNIIRYCQKLILACFIDTLAFQSLKYNNCFDNCIYAHILLKKISKFKT